MVSSSRKYLAEDIFFRKVQSGNIVLYQTSQEKVMVLDGVVYDILKDFQKTSLASEDYKPSNKHGNLTEDQYASIIEQLTKLGILIDEHQLIEKKNSLEGQIKYRDYDSIHALYGVQFELTFRCNERCRHCYCPRENDIKNELTTEEIKRVLDDLEKMNVVEVTFTGGDLFMRNDTFEILEYAFKLGFVINIFTNGTLLKDEDFYKLQKLHLRSIHFSIYNYIPEKHDAFTKLPGSFEKTCKAIKKCQALGIPVNIKVSLLEENYDDIDGILELAERLGTTIQLSLSITPTNEGSMESTKHRLHTSEEYANIMKKVDNHVLLTCGNGTYLDGAKLDRSHFLCGAGSFSLNVNPYGEVFACNALLMPLGNLRKQTIKEIWETSKVLKVIRGFRTDDLKGCEHCEKMDKCDFCPGNAMQESGDPLRKYSEACMITEAKIIKEGR